MLASGILAPGPLFISNVGCADYLNSQFLLSNSDSFFSSSFSVFSRASEGESTTGPPDWREDGKMGSSYYLCQGR